MARRRLDSEMGPFRRAALLGTPTNELLRAVRHVLHVPAMEIARKMCVHRSVLFALEMSERRKTITLQSMERVARAMGCKVVYGVVPEKGGTLEELAQERMWRGRLGTKEQGIGIRGQRSEIRGQGLRDSGLRD
jgi:hypothetical protein